MLLLKLRVWHLVRLTISMIICWLVLLFLGRCHRTDRFLSQASLPVMLCW